MSPVSSVNLSSILSTVSPFGKPAAVPKVSLRLQELKFSRRVCFNVMRHSVHASAFRVKSSPETLSILSLLRVFSLPTRQGIPQTLPLYRKALPAGYLALPGIVIARKWRSLSRHR